MKRNGLTCHERCDDGKATRSGAEIQTREGVHPAILRDGVCGVNVTFDMANGTEVEERAATDMWRSSGAAVHVNRWVCWQLEPKKGIEPLTYALRGRPSRTQRFVVDATGLDGRFVDVVGVGGSDGRGWVCEMCVIGTEAGTLG